MENIRLLFDLAKNNKWEEFNNILKTKENLDVNLRDDSNNYLIHYAIIQNNYDSLLLLIEKGSNIDIIDQDGKSILFIPIKYNYENIIKLLITSNNKKIGISLLDLKDKLNNIPLHYAINYKNIAAINLLLEAGSNVNDSDNAGFNSLHLSILTKNINICEMILKFNIHINAKTKIGETALHLACNFQLENIVKLLVEHNIDINIQDFDHEFTALHYSINLYNNNITKFLIIKGGDPNIQDFLGNTTIHYAIIEDNYEIFMFLLTSEYTIYKLNLNLFNIDSKLPLHLLLEKNINNLFEYVKYLIKDSNLNFQDLDNNTPFHYISKNSLWKNYKELFQEKKLDVFIKNNNNLRPIDLINKIDLDDYINLICDSYLYILKNRNNIWKNDWENLCNKELFTGTLTNEEIQIINKTINTKKLSPNQDICKQLVKKKLLQIYEKGYSNCELTSYPVKKNKKCIELNNINNVEFCTFTGVTLDVLVGLIYLLSKHKNACSPISTNFLLNDELCNYYKTVGILTNTKCEFLNFEIVWIYYKLYFSTNFINNFKKCIDDSNKRFIIMPLGIELREGSHANYLLFDKKTKELERFEPYGAQPPYKFDYNPNLLDSLIDNKFNDIDSTIKFIRPLDYMPKIGFQYFDTIENKTKNIGDPGGFCALWSIWYTDYRIIYSDISRKSLVKQIMRNIKTENISFKNIIRNYSKNVTDIRDEILNKNGISINNWLNDQFNEIQIKGIIKDITQFILDYSS
ncbi:Ankyrin repeat protein [uncultured virus]|nr:Ankyrin repeat protein [uncultured virus]